MDYGPPCIQFMDFHKNDRFSGPNMPNESEDCLYLNIFSPYDSEDESKVYPIIVWIHGGSFLAGSADTGIEMEAAAKNLVFKGKYIQKFLNNNNYYYYESILLLHLTITFRCDPCNYQLPSRSPWIYVS